MGKVKSVFRNYWIPLLLVVVYFAYYGKLLYVTDGLPYVLDNNESFSAFWHAINFHLFDFSKTFGLTDEAFSLHLEAHPYAYTHQGNFPRVFAYLIYVLGAQTIQSQIVVTTFTIGLAAIFFAYVFVKRIVDERFAFIFCSILITDYFLVAQWQVVTYRVWHEFFVFSSLLCIQYLSTRRWQVTFLTIVNFACLFYFELIFAAFVATSSALYAVLLYRKSFKTICRIWVLESIGASIALMILATQITLYMGWDNFVQDFVITFLSRNQQAASEANISQIQQFFELHHIAFWYNFQSGAELRSLKYFIGSIVFFDFGPHTPALLVMMGVFVIAIVLSCFHPTFLLLDKNATSVVKSNSSPSFLSWLLRIARAILGQWPGLLALAFASIHLFHKYLRGDIGLLQILTLKAMALAILVFISICFIAGRWEPVFKTGFRIPFPQPESSKLFYIAVLMLLSPSLLTHVSRIPSLGFGYSITYFFFLLAYGLSLAASFIYEGKRLETAVANDAKATFGQPQSYTLPTPRYLPLRLFIFFIFVLPLFFYSLISDYRVLGLNEMSPWLTSKIALSVGVILSLLICSISIIILRRENAAITKSLGDIFDPLRTGIFLIVVATLFLLAPMFSNPVYQPVWKEILESTTGPVVFRIGLVASVLVGIFWIRKGIHVSFGEVWSQHMSNIMSVLAAGFLGYTIIYMLSPGYIFTGYRFRFTPFFVFHADLALAFVVYTLSVSVTRAFRAKEFLANFGLNQTRLIKLCSAVALGIFTYYWVGMQVVYERLLPPNHFQFLKLLGAPPYKGATTIVNTYAAPIAAFTGNWSYLHDELSRNHLSAGRQGYVFEPDPTYLWLADKTTNPSYAHPQYYVCVSGLGLPNLAFWLLKKQTEQDTDLLQESKSSGCGNDIMVKLATGQDSTSVTPPVSLSAIDQTGPQQVGFVRWAIVKLNWETTKNF